MYSQTFSKIKNEINLFILLILLFKTFSFIRFETLHQLKFYVSFLFKGQK